MKKKTKKVRKNCQQQESFVRECSVIWFSLQPLHSTLKLFFFLLLSYSHSCYVHITTWLFIYIYNLCHTYLLCVYVFNKLPLGLWSSHNSLVIWYAIYIGTSTRWQIFFQWALNSYHRSFHKVRSIWKPFPFISPGEMTWTKLVFMDICGCVHVYYDDDILIRHTKLSISFLSFYFFLLQYTYM